MDESRKSALQTKLSTFVAQGFLLGGGVAGSVGGTEYTYTAGYQDIAKTIPFTDKTIFRLASDSKLIGTTAFLRLVDRGDITALEPLKRWIPEFEQTKVLKPVTPAAPATLANALRTTAGSTVVQVAQMFHGLTSGDLIGIQSAVDVGGIPATVINQLHVVTVLNPHRYTITLTQAAVTSVTEGGGVFTVHRVPLGTKQTSFQGVIYYYQEEPLKRDILVYHVLTHTLGYLYNVLVLGTSFGYVDGRDDPVRLIKSNIQAGIMQNLLMPTVVPLTPAAALYPDIQTWVRTLATVPLLYQPGEDWSYGPTLSILGSLIELVDGRGLEQYFKEEITDPLGMPDTGFFIQNDDPGRADKISRVMDLPVPLGGGFFLDGSLLIPGINDYFYGSQHPKTLAFIDGGMFSTLEDRSKFYKMLLNNGRYLVDGVEKTLISSAVISWMSHNRVNDLVPRPRAPPLKQLKWGLGVGVSAGTDFDLSLAGQTTRAITWSGAFNSSFLVDFGNDGFFNYATNTIDAENGPYIYALLTNLHMATVAKVTTNEQDVAPNASTSIGIFA